MSRAALLALGAVVVAVVALLLVATAGPGYRAGFWDFRMSFSMMRWGLYAGAFALVMIFAAWFVGRADAPRGPLVLATIAALIAIGGPLLYARGAAGVPAIHDITTSPEDPPLFVALLPLRVQDGATNPPEYAGENVAREQRAAYPDIRSLVLPLAPADALQRAVRVADDMEWRVVEMNPDEGRLEAVATTPWFGFRDDVIVRVRAEGQGSRVDVRSKSRVGRSDLGANAKRIRAFLKKMVAEP